LRVVAAANGEHDIGKRHAELERTADRRHIVEGWTWLNMAAGGVDKPGA
jgi:hypothetical protein